jgi:hypothetical protein
MPGQTKVSISADAFYINGQPTYVGRSWTGCASRVCCSTAGWCRGSSMISTPIRALAGHTPIPAAGIPNGTRLSSVQRWRSGAHMVCSHSR